jgi:hypothetical protein
MKPLALVRCHGRLFAQSQKLMAEIKPGQTKLFAKENCRARVTRHNHGI